MNRLDNLGRKCCGYYAMLKKVSYGNEHPVKMLLNQYDEAHPGLNSFELKAAQYEILAENIEVVVFEETPFYFINNIILISVATDICYFFIRNTSILYTKNTYF